MYRLFRYDHLGIFRPSRVIASDSDLWTSRTVDISSSMMTIAPGMGATSTNVRIVY
jgi:hypothetical protein